MNTRPFGDDNLDHWVSKEKFDPHVAEALTPEQERIYMASQWRMMWIRFKRHKFAVWSGALLAVIYFSVLISEMIAPYNMHSRNTDHIYAPPQTVHIFHDGELRAPFTYAIKYTLNMDNLKREYTEDPTSVTPVRFFCLGDKYHYWGLVPMRFHLICPPKGGTLFLLGTDRLGRDMFSRIVMGTRISLTVGLIGITISFFLGMLIGGLAGYYGGWVDNITQRAIEVIRSFPELPLWMALSAALPVTWSPILIYFGITIILGLLDWTGLARAVRSKLLSVREEDFVSAARLMGANVRAVRMIGSTAICLAWVAAGRASGFYAGLHKRDCPKQWDWCAGHAIVCAAGGVFLRHGAQRELPFDIDCSGCVCAGSPELAVTLQREVDAVAR